MRSHPAILLLLLFPLGSFVKCEELPVDPATDETSASGVIRVICDPRSGLANRITLEAMLQSADVRRMLAESLFESPDQVDKVADVKFKLSDEVAAASAPGVFVSKISVRSTQSDVPASNVLNVIAPVLTKYLMMDGDVGLMNQVELTDRLAADVDRDLAELNRLYRSLAQLETLLGATRGAANAVLSSRLQRLEHLTQLQDETHLERIMLETRITLLKNQISNVGSKAAVGGDLTPAEGEVLKQIDSLRKEVGTLQKSEAGSLGTNLRAVLAELRAAEMELARIKGARVANSSERVTTLRMELEDAESAYHALDRKREFLASQMGKLTEETQAVVAAISATEPSVLQLQISVAEDRYRRRAQQLDEAHQATRAYQRPLVTIIR